MLKLNKDRLNEVLKKASDFKTVLEVEKDISELVSAYKTISDAYSELKKAFTDSEYNSIEGDVIKVSKYETGSRFKLVDPKKCDPSLMEVKLNPKAVEEYVKTKNLIPEGVEECSRSLAVRITLK